MICLWTGLALAAAPERIEQRLEATAELRELRMGTAAPTIPTEAFTKAAGGDVVTGLEKVPDHAARKAWGLRVVDVPIGDYFSAINDDVNKAAYSKLAHVLLLDGQVCGSKRLVFQFLDVPFITDRWWVVEQRINEPLQARSAGKVREMFYRDVPDAQKHFDAQAKAVADGGMPIAFTQGGWWLTDLGEDQTLVEFWSWTDPGGNVPAGPASAFSSRGISDIMDAMARLARAGSACKL